MTLTQNDPDYEDIESRLLVRQKYRSRILCIVIWVWHKTEHPCEDQFEQLALAFQRNPRNEFEGKITAKEVEEEYNRLRDPSRIKDEFRQEVYDVWTEDIREQNDREEIIDAYRRWFSEALGKKSMAAKDDTA
ncbi:MAG: hypothetical protein L6R42_002679 [Xanthoria sp. 1 TBL-2021]|nr:MAG: hypothetical protein L6R42_002679 [Xanthoria sp. 1 TBL-2021]